MQVDSTVQKALDRILDGCLDQRRDVLDKRSIRDAVGALRLYYQVCGGSECVSGGGRNSFTQIATGYGRSIRKRGCWVKRDWNECYRGNGHKVVRKERRGWKARERTRGKGGQRLKVKVRYGRVPDEAPSRGDGGLCLEVWEEERAPALGLDPSSREGLRFGREERLENQVNPGI